MSLRLRITPQGGEPFEVPILPAAVRELEQQHGKPWPEIVALNSEWAYYAAWRYAQLRKDESRSIEKYIESLDGVEVGRDDVDPSRGQGQPPAD